MDSDDFHFLLASDAGDEIDLGPIDQTSDSVVLCRKLRLRAPLHRWHRRAGSSSACTRAVIVFSAHGIVHAHAPSPLPRP